MSRSKKDREQQRPLRHGDEYDAFWWNVLNAILKKKIRKRALLGLLAIACSLLIITSPSSLAWGQNLDGAIPDINLEQINTWLDFRGKNSGIETAVLRLDGRRLFVITAPQVVDDVSVEAPSAKQRVAEIEARLNQFVSNGFNPNTLEVTYQIQNDLPVIYANGEVLLTITTKDAAIYGVDIETRANDVTTQIKDALIRAQAERQPDVIQRQFYKAIVILLSLIVISYLTSLMQKCIQQRRRRLKKEAKANATEALTLDDTKPVSPVVINTALKHSSKHKWQQLHGLQQELLQVWQVILWLVGVLIILGLFPLTRWLQVVLANAIQLPLTLLSIGFGFYLIIRLSTLLIDGFFKPLEAGDFLSPEAAQKLLEPEVIQRLALRISTLSQVLKNVVAIAFSILAILVMMTVVGVPLGPLIAGAGVLGLTVSFASQSVLKDSINGFLIFLEDQYGVGDWITIGDLSGLVEKLGLRITQLRDIEGALITIPNGDVRAVKNLSKNWARVDINIPIAYTANLMKAMQLMDIVAWEMHQDPEWQELILEPPQLMGADDFGDQGVIVKLWIKTLPLEQWKIAREYRRRLKLAFDHAGIPLPLPQQVLWVKSPPSADES
jgi:small conductance mechanosensitive channel